MAFMRNLVRGDCGFQTHFRSRLILSWPSNFWAYAARRTTPRSIHRLTFNSNDTWLSEIVDLTTLKLFGLRSRGLQSRRGKNSHSGSASPYKSSSASARSSRFRLCCKDFAKISSISNWFTKSTAAHIHRFARFIHLFRGFWTTWHDLWNTRDSASWFSLGHVFPSPVHLVWANWHSTAPPSSHLFVISQILGDTWPAPTRVSPLSLQGAGRGETLGTSFYPIDKDLFCQIIKFTIIH